MSLSRLISRGALKALILSMVCHGALMAYGAYAELEQDIALDRQNTSPPFGRPVSKVELIKISPPQNRPEPAPLAPPEKIRPEPVKKMPNAVPITKKTPPAKPATPEPAPAQAEAKASEAMAAAPPAPTHNEVRPLVSENPGPVKADIGSATGAKFKKKATPQYPPAELRRQREGTVILRLRIDASGILTGLEIVKSAGPLFDAAALKAIRASSFIPAEAAGQAQASIGKVSIKFVLKKR